MTRHRWEWKDNDSGTCKHCGAKTKLVARKKERGEGKTSYRVYAVKASKTFDATTPPKCIDK